MDVMLSKERSVKEALTRMMGGGLSPEETVEDLAPLHNTAKTIQFSGVEMTIERSARAELNAFGKPLGTGGVPWNLYDKEVKAMELVSHVGFEEGSGRYEKAQGFGFKVHEKDVEKFIFGKRGPGKNRASKSRSRPLALSSRVAGSKLTVLTLHRRCVYLMCQVRSSRHVQATMCYNVASYQTPSPLHGQYRSSSA